MNVITKIQVGQTRFTWAEHDGNGDLVGEHTEAEALILENAGTHTIVDYVGSVLEQLKFADTEIVWRDGELIRIREEIYILEDVSLSYSATAYRAYAVLLRGWPQHQDFPDMNERPVSP